MHLQESTLFDLDLQVKVTLNVAQCPLHHVTYAPTVFEGTRSKALGLLIIISKEKSGYNNNNNNNGDKSFAR